MQAQKGEVTSPEQLLQGGIKTQATYARIPWSSRRVAVTLMGPPVSHIHIFKKLAEEQIKNVDLWDLPPRNSNLENQL